LAIATSDQQEPMTRRGNSTCGNGAWIDTPAARQTVA
jgi:hypothetical protein